MFGSDFPHEQRMFSTQQPRQRIPCDEGILFSHMQSGAGTGAGATALNELPGPHSRNTEDIQSSLVSVDAIMDGRSMNMESQLSSQYEPPRTLHLQSNQLPPYRGGWVQGHPQHAHETQSDSAYFTSSERRESTALSVASGHYASQHGMPSSDTMSPMVDPRLGWIHPSTSSRASVLDYDSNQNDAQAADYFGGIGEKFSDIDSSQTNVREPFSNQMQPFSNQMQPPRDSTSEDPLDYIDPQIATQATQNPPSTSPATIQDTTSAGSSGKQFRCMFRYAGCESSFGRKQDWKKHLTSRHHLEHPAIYRCTEKECNQPVDYIFSRKDHLKEHLKKIHHFTQDTGFPDKDLEKDIEARRVPDFLRCGFCAVYFRQGGMSDWAKVLHHVSQHYAPNSTHDWVPYHEFTEWADRESMLAKIKPRRARR